MTRPEAIKQLTESYIETFGKQPDVTTSAAIRIVAVQVEAGKGFEWREENGFRRVAFT